MIVFSNTLSVSVLSDVCGVGVVFLLVLGLCWCLMVSASLLVRLCFVVVCVVFFVPNDRVRQGN